MSRAILDRGNGKGWDATWTGGAWELVDFLKSQVGDEWVRCTILHTDMMQYEAANYEYARQATIKRLQEPAKPPVVEQLPAEREWRPARKAWEPSPPINGLEADVPHNYVTGIGDVFDWLDCETKELVRTAIDIEPSYDLDQLELPAVYAHRPKTPEQMKRVRLRKRNEAA